MPGPQWSRRAPRSRWAGAEESGRSFARRSPLADDAGLVGETGALIVTAGCSLDVDVRISLGAGAALTWTEIVVLGRTGESAGSVRLTWDVERGGWPLLRQTTDLSDQVRRDWPGTIAGARVLAAQLRVGPGVRARTFAPSATAAVHALAADAELITVLAQDAVSAREQLCALFDEIGRPADQEVVRSSESSPSV